LYFAPSSVAVGGPELLLPQAAPPRSRKKDATVKQVRAARISMQISFERQWVAMQDARLAKSVWSLG
jgi:hypothetical protein